MRKMQVLGIELQDHTVREAMKKRMPFCGTEKSVRLPILQCVV